MHQIETWFGSTTRQAIRCDTFTSVKMLITQSRYYIAHWSTIPKPFAWSAIADEIFAKPQLVQFNLKKTR